MRRKHTRISAMPSEKLRVRMAAVVHSTPISESLQEAQRLLTEERLKNLRLLLAIERSLQLGDVRTLREAYLEELEKAS